MTMQQSLVVVKPDGIVKSLTGNIITTLSETKLKIVGAKIIKVPKHLAEKHYIHLKKDKPEIFENVVRYMMGEFHTDRVLALVYQGENAVEMVRKICGSTNPEDADPTSIRGRYGRINSKTGVFENVIHASDSAESAEREIKMWFTPDEIVDKIYPTKEVKTQREEIEWA
ncbi:MAG: nucleoside-diphosphate kinase [archaeon]